MTHKTLDSCNVNNLCPPMHLVVVHIQIILLLDVAGENSAEDENLGVWDA